MSDLDIALKALRIRLALMFDLLDEQLAETVNALVTNDLVSAREVREADEKIDALALENDFHCFHILNNFQPQNSALYGVIAAMRIGSNLERIGDLCKNICKKIPEIGESNGWHSTTNILDIADAARKMVRSARDAFANQNRLQARQVLAYDRQIDRAYREVLHDIVAFSNQNTLTPIVVVHLASVSKSFERMADHAKSIARSVVYAIEGKDIRYKKLPVRKRPTLESHLDSTNALLKSAF